jgi:hypothetical protein
LKDQYFGDARDYFKYHLLEELMRSVRSLERLVCLWMLTPPDETREGNVRFVENLELPSLTAFLRGHLEIGDRRVRHMREYMRGRGLEYIPWGDEPPYFSGKGRWGYFNSVPDDHLRHALVFFDPDIGLTNKRPTRKHLSIHELADVYDRMDNHSVAVVFQYWNRAKGFWTRRAQEIAARLAAPVAYLAEPSVAFYVVAKSSREINSIEQTLHRVASAHASRTVGLVKG